jgi:hypothetical protein
MATLGTAAYDPAQAIGTDDGRDGPPQPRAENSHSDDHDDELRHESILFPGAADHAEWKTRL